MLEVMKTNVIGHVRSIKLNHRRDCLLPLFEAVINSLHAIEDHNIDNGSIKITLQRSAQKNIVEGAIGSIEGFKIEDDGIGFNNINYNSFKEDYSTLKQSRGGKGVGRFTWLKVFREVRVESIFMEDGEKWRCKFNFCCTPNGIENYKKEKINASSDPPSTQVILYGFDPRYQKNCPKEPLKIARQIVIHCLEYFLLKKPPKIQLIDPILDEKLDLNVIFETNFQPDTKPRQFKIKDETFTIYDVLVKRPHDHTHQIYFCGDRRVVTSKPISNKIIPHLGETLYDKDNNPFTYSAYVSGPFLDKRLEDDRTSFRIYHESEFYDEPTWQEILINTIEKVKEFLYPHTAYAYEKITERVQSYVQEEPKYRYLLNTHLKEIQTLPLTISDQNLDLELHKLHLKVKQQLKQEAYECFAQQETEKETNWGGYQEKFDKFLRMLNDVTKSELAEYVVQRKTVLAVLEKMLGRDDDGKYTKEKAIHNIIFPIHQTSDDTEYENHNLWIVDERLAYHYYLASDIPFNQQDDSPVIVQSDDRADVLIFNKAFALVESDYNFSSVVIIEFKRPERSSYLEDKDPINQVLKYVRLIREGKAKNKRGQTLTVSPQIPFYCYIIATLTPQLKEEAGKFLQPTPDHNGYFGYSMDPRAYIEIISFNKLIADAKNRNRAFFEKLNLPKSL